MKKTIPVFLALCVMLLGLVGCGATGSNSGTAELTFNGKKYQIQHVEFAVEVNPVIGKPNLVRTIERGKPQAIRFSLRTERWGAKLWDGKAFVIAWWKDGDDPMKLLNDYVGRELTDDDRRDDAIYANFLLDGKSIEPALASGASSWIIIDKVEDGMVSGRFAGRFRLKDGKTFKSIGEATIEGGSFSAPLRINFERK